ncbi:MAG: LamG domain-containing protein [Pseudomonadales bacterium]|nr:LamG domain-containing protein [Pseudomonadales bacterium]
MMGRLINLMLMKCCAGKQMLCVMLAFLCASNIFAATYTMTELEGTALDVPTSSTTVSWDNTDTSYPNDDDQTVVNIGFTFRFAATDYTQVRIHTNGILQFGASTRMHRDYRNENLPTNDGDNIILVYWDDLVDDSSGSVTYGNSGTAPNRKFIVTYNNVRAYSNRSNRYDFQVVLYENGDIRYRYDNNTANGQSATIGIEVDDTDYTLYSYNTTSVRTDFDLLFKNSLLGLPTPVINWRFDETVWSGTAGEVVDSSGNGLNGTASGGVTTQNSNPAISGSTGTCRYGDFDGNDDLVQIPDTASLDLATAFTIGVWINIDSIPSSGLKSILSKDENFEFHVNSSGRIYWWWRDSAGTRTLTSTTSVTAGQWHHIVIRFQAGQQDIFIDGINRGTASNALTPTTNSDPFQIGGDQGFGGREFNGLIDEVAVFDTPLSDLQILTLLNDTHACAAESTCSASFPDGASSYNSGSISFGYNAQLFFSPDNALEFNSVSLNGGSTVSSCVTADCTASSSSVPALTLPTFPSTSFSTDLTVSSGGTGTLGNAGTNEYDDVRARSNSTLNVSSSYSSYYMDTLRLDSGSTLNLVAGDYWVRSLTVNSSSTITVSGGTARLFVQNDISFGSSSLINSPSQGSAGDSSELLFVGYGDVRFRSNSTTSALVYAVGDARLDSPSYVYGAITADDFTLNSNAQIRYQSSGVSQLDFGTLCNSSCTLGSFNITQPTYGLACPSTRAAVSVTALCTDGSTKTDYTGTVALSGPSTSTFYDAATGGSSLTNYTFVSGDSGVRTFYLYFNNENSNVQTTITDSSASVASTAATGTDFRANGLSLATSNTVCTTTGTATLTAIGQTQTGSGQECEVLTGFSGNKDFDVWFTIDTDNDGSADTNRTMTVGSASVTNSSDPNSDNVTLSFTNGVASFNLAYEDVGSILSLNFEHDDAPYSGSPYSALVTSTNSLVFYPSSFSLSASSGGTALNAATSTATPVHAAGQSFDLSIQAICSDASNADDYEPSANANFRAALVRTGPTSGGGDGQLEVKSGPVDITSSTTQTFASMGIDKSDFSNGAYSYAQANYSEVGLIRLDIQDNNYFGVTSIPTASLNIGRFVPDRFEVAVLNAGTLLNACDSSATDFTYNGESFGFDASDLPTITITPENANGGTTLNYIGAYKKLTNNELTFATTITSSNAGVDASNLAITASYSTGSLSDDSNPHVSVYEFTSTDTFTYTRVANAAVNPFNASFNIILSAIDDGDGGDGIDGGSFSLTPGGTIVQRYGRLNVENAFGPETEDLGQSVTTQYLNAGSYITNTDDDCTQITTGMITIPGGSTTNITVGGGTSNLSFDGTFTDGDGNFSYSAPGAGNIGSISIDFDLSSRPWLQFDWDADGSDDNPPQKTAAFGQYRGHDRVIYWREVTY